MSSQLLESNPVASQFDRLPPSAIEAEMCVLAAMMLDKEQIGQIQRQAMGGILARDTLPIWDAVQWVDARTTLPARIREAVPSRWGEVVRYARDPSSGMPWHVGTFVVLTWFFSDAQARDVPVP